MDDPKQMAATAEFAKPRSMPATALSADVRETIDFVERVLPLQRGRLLDVGCGRGRVARELLARGFEVTAIDSSSRAVAEAKSSGIDAVHTDFQSFEDTPFDVLFFSASLHHIYPLPQAVAHARALLRRGGWLVVSDFAVDEIDRPTAWWFYQIQEMYIRIGLFAEHALRHPEIADPVQRWQADHQEEPPLHGAQAMLSALRQCFGELKSERGPYLYRYICEHLAASTLGASASGAVLKMESAGIAEGILRPIGLRMWAQHLASDRPDSGAKSEGT